MKNLSIEAFQRVQAYLDANGRAVDKARFAYHFSGGTQTDVLMALAHYQNDDGGFGHGLEADLRTAASSAIGTQTALDIMREIGTPSTDVLVQRAIDYLLTTLDRTELLWPIVPPAVEDAPHAPWWTYGESAGSGDGFRSNPRAALIGFLCEHHDLVPLPLLQQLVDVQLAHLMAQPVAEGVEMHALACYVTLAHSPNLPSAQRNQLVATLTERVAGTVISDPSAFSTYGLLPLDVAPTPDAPLAPTVDRSAVDAHLDWVIDTQLSDGSWPLAWSWAFVDEDAWAQAERDWKGKIAVDRLRILAKYGRIAGR